MDIQYNINLTNGTKNFVQRNLNVSLYKDNNRLYEIADLLKALDPKELIGVDKNDLKVLNNLSKLGTKFISL